MQLASTEPSNNDSEMAAQMSPTGITSPVFPTPSSPTLNRAKCKRTLLLATPVAHLLTCAHLTY